VSACSSLRGTPPANNDPRIVSGILGVAEPITVPTWELFGDDRITRGAVAQSVPALLFADDRG
jgi:hypothetical protein